MLFQDDGIISTLPDELLLYIFQHLEGLQIVSSVAPVSKRWKHLSSEPKLWRNRFIFYNSKHPGLFVEIINNACNQNIKYLHLGAHEPLADIAIQALFSSNVFNVKKLSFLGSCRTSPSKVIKLLSQVSLNIESLTLCVNDELVSYGEDGKTCYSLTGSNARPGLLFKVISCMENLKSLRLCGGFSTRWYFGELLKEPGCNKIEALDLKDFEEVSDNFSSYRKIDFVRALLIKNKNCLKSLKVSEKCIRNPDVRDCVRECGGTLKELSVNLAQADSLIDFLPKVTSLHLGGRYNHDWGHDPAEVAVANYAPVIARMEELSLFQFTHIQPHDFFLIVRPFQNLKVLRLEGCLFTKSNFDTVGRCCPLLERLCLRDTKTVAERHLISMRVHFGVLKDFNLEEVSDLDCQKPLMYLQKLPFLKLCVYHTDCSCKNKLHVACDLLDMTDYSLRLDHCNNDHYKKRDMCLDVTMSNGLKDEYFSEFKGFDENDLIFHFNH